MVDSDLPHGHTHLTIPNNRFSRAVFLANKEVWTLQLSQLGSFSVTSCQMSGPSASKFKFIFLVLKRYFAPQQAVHGDLFIHPIDLKHQNDGIVHIPPGNCSLASNCSITTSYLKWIKGHIFGYIKSTPFAQKIIQILSLYESAAEKVTVTGMINVCSFITLSDAEEVYFVYFSLICIKL